MNWSFSLPGFLEIIICEKIFAWGSVEDEHIDIFIFVSIRIDIYHRYSHHYINVKIQINFE